MALIDRIPLDNHNVFMNLGQFAETHLWNGVPIVCVEDDTEALKRKNNNVVDISWDNNTIDKVIFVPEDNLPGPVAPNTTVVYDRTQMRVLDVIDAMGMKEIHLSLNTTKVMG